MYITLKPTMSNVSAEKSTTYQIKYIMYVLWILYQWSVIEHLFTENIQGAYEDPQWVNIKDFMTQK